MPPFISILTDSGSYFGCFPLLDKDGFLLENDRMMKSVTRSLSISLFYILRGLLFWQATDRSLETHMFEGLMINFYYRKHLS